MYKQLVEYCKMYEPLSMDEQNDLLNEGLSEEDLLTELIKHNSRMIIREVHKWRKTFDDLDDVSMVAIQGVMRAYNKWDSTKYLFGIHIRPYISALIHRQWKKHICIADHIDPSDLELEDVTIDSYSDLRDVLESSMKDVLDEKEYQFIKDIYFNHMTVSQAGSNYGYTVNPSKSRKKMEILRKLKDNLPDNLVLLYTGNELGGEHV